MSELTIENAGLCYWHAKYIKQLQMASRCIIELERKALFPERIVIGAQHPIIWIKHTHRTDMLLSGVYMIEGRGNGRTEYRTAVLKDCEVRWKCRLH